MARARASDDGHAASGDPSNAAGADFETVMRHLRGLAADCEPPIGVGSFLVLYANQTEIVVWYSPAREAHRAGEVSIPRARLAAAWSELTAGVELTEADLERLGEGPAGGRWLLALLAQLPGVSISAEPLVLRWHPPARRTVRQTARVPRRKQVRTG